MRTNILNRWQRREMCKHFLRACRVAAIVGIAVGFWLHLDIALGMSAAVQPVLLAFSVVIFPVWGAALLIGLRVGDRVVRERGLSLRFLASPKEVWHQHRTVIGALIEGAPRWVLGLALFGIAGAIVLPGKGDTSALLALTPEDARIGANVCLFFFSTSAPVLFSRGARALAERATA